MTIVKVNKFFTFIVRAIEFARPNTLFKSHYLQHFNIFYTPSSPTTINPFTKKIRTPFSANSLKNKTAPP